MTFWLLSSKAEELKLANLAGIWLNMIFILCLSFNIIKHKTIKLFRPYYFYIVMLICRVFSLFLAAFKCVSRFSLILRSLRFNVDLIMSELSAIIAGHLG